MPRSAGGERMDWCYDSAGTSVDPGPNRISLWVEPVKHSVKCDTQGCHRRKRVSLEELSLRVFDNPEEYDLDITLGELVVEAARETPRWRLCFGPEMT